MPAAVTQQPKTNALKKSAFVGAKSKQTLVSVPGPSNGALIVCEAQRSGDRWAGLGTDISDDQQDITRGKGMVDSLFQVLLFI